ncbi:MAG: hypothetical protein Q7R56_03660 [Nanoarchaeota archaeon]|nr:hypothetical protein [Nanoarchaeota archaeon]
MKDLREGFSVKQENIDALCRNILYQDLPVPLIISRLVLAHAGTAEDPRLEGKLILTFYDNYTSPPNCTSTRSPKIQGAYVAGLELAVTRKPDFGQEISADLAFKKPPTLSIEQANTSETRLSPALLRENKILETLARQDYLAIHEMALRDSSKHSLPQVILTTHRDPYATNFPFLNRPDSEAIKEAIREGRNVYINLYTFTQNVLHTKSKKYSEAQLEEIRDWFETLKSKFETSI